MIHAKNLLLALLVIGSTPLPCVAADNDAGSDMPPVFARAAKGEPLHYVALGASINYGGKGWIGDWLKAQFPKNAVTTVNSGISATGSELGVFRVERDVIAHQPDLVAIEFCVNDWGLTDDEVNRYMETLIVRLKSLPHPPAIVILEAAAKNGVNLARHRKVAQHYGFLEVDLQDAVNAEFAKSQKDWTSLFKDAVHPNEAGNALYTQMISGKLAPFVEKAKVGATVTPKPLPPMLSTKPLLLDAHLVELVNYVAGWQPEAVPGWPGLYFHGVVSAKKPGDTLLLPLQSSTLGLFYAQQEGYGIFTAHVDGQPPKMIDANVKHLYNYVLLGKDMTPGEHTITVSVPTDPAEFRPVKLGYVLVSGDSTPAR